MVKLETAESKASNLDIEVSKMLYKQLKHPRWPEKRSEERHGTGH